MIIESNSATSSELARGAPAAVIGGVKKRRVLRRILVRAFQVVFFAAAALGTYTAVVSYRYDVPPSEAAGGVLRELTLLSVRAAVSAYDPCEPRVASTGPADGDVPNGAEYSRIEHVLVPGRTRTLAAGVRITSLEVNNEVIKRSPYTFRYQPYEEPRLSELRRKYRLDDVTAPATTEFEAMVLLRNWTRSRFRRGDYQPNTDNFDALEVLDRNSRDHGEPYSPGRHMDPCVFFPTLYCQVLLSMGHQARMVSAEHGMAEVWSNQFRKWVLMDAELNHHFEKDGVPLNMVELLEAKYAGPQSGVRLVRGEQTSGDEDTLKVHLHIEHPTAELLLTWFDRPLELTDRRNDWMTNHYFRGHPARSEVNSLIFVHPRVTEPVKFKRRLWAVTSSREDFYWTLNQAEIRAKWPADEGIDLSFGTVTPNFDYFEVSVDGGAPTRHRAPTFRWRLHDGVNAVAVRPVNQFGVPGIESRVRLSVTEGPR